MAPGRAEGEDGSVDKPGPAEPDLAQPANITTPAIVKIAFSRLEMRKLSARWMSMILAAA
jgi:hypothetical protein